MAAPEGSYIRNWWAGRVVDVSDKGACGTSVIIESGEWEHVYCHMQGYVRRDGSGRYLLDRAGGIQIWEGQHIPVGTRIGRVGMTGRTTGPHLHWGLKYTKQLGGSCFGSAGNVCCSVAAPNYFSGALKAIALSRTNYSPSSLYTCFGSLWAS